MTTKLAATSASSLCAHILGAGAAAMVPVLAINHHNEDRVWYNYNRCPNHQWHTVWNGAQTLRQSQLIQPRRCWPQAHRNANADRHKLYHRPLQSSSTAKVNCKADGSCHKGYRGPLPSKSKDACHTDLWMWAVNVTAMEDASTCNTYTNNLNS